MLYFSVFRCAEKGRVLGWASKKEQGDEFSFPSAAALYLALHVPMPFHSPGISRWSAIKALQWLIISFAPLYHNVT